MPDSKTVIRALAVLFCLMTAVTIPSARVELVNEDQDYQPHAGLWPARKTWDETIEGRFSTKLP